MLMSIPCRHSGRHPLQHEVQTFPAQVNSLECRSKAPGRIVVGRLRPIPLSIAIPTITDDYWNGMRSPATVCRIPLFQP